MDTQTDENVIVVAIDFGTTYSGYAFSFRNDYIKNNSMIFTSVWAENQGCQKAPTSVLFDPNKQFDSFGFDAEDRYAQLSADGKANEYYFFSRFKLTLYNIKTVTRDFDIIANNGKKLSAMTVFSACIQYMVEDVIKTINAKIIGSENESGSTQASGSETLTDDNWSIGLEEKSGLKESHFRWVLTVPAIWNDAAKQFMREAAEKAGIPGHQLLIALEPEAASIYCQSSPVRMLDGSENVLGPLQPGDKYLILDAGGGTIDVTVHKVHHDGTLRELHAASGGDWGGTKVDKAFNDLLLKVVGNVVMEKVNRKDKWSYMELFREFEVKKRTFKPGKADRIIMRAPIAFSKTYKKEHGRKLKEAIDENVAYKGRITWFRDKMQIEADIFRGFFSESCKKIGKHLEKMFNYPVIKDVTNILMVGGYSESPVLQDFIRRKFGEKKVTIAYEPILAVLKGAVMFGFKPHVIAERICKFTYGCSKSVPFIRGVHPLDKKYITDHGTENCVDVFEKFAEIGEPIKTGKPQYKTARVPADRKQKEITTRIFASVVENPMYVTDKSCMYIGTIRVPLVETEGLDRRVSLKIYISGTEIEVEAEEENTGEKMLAKLEFLG